MKTTLCRKVEKLQKGWSYKINFIRRCYDGTTLEVRCWYSKLRLLKDMFLGFSFLLSGLRRISTLISGTATDVSDDDGISPVFCNQTFFVTKFLFLYSLISSFHLFFLLYHHIFSYFISSLIRRYVSYVNSESGILR